MTHRNSQEELQFGSMFQSVKKGYESFLIRFYRFSHFLIKSWWILLLLIVGGALLGYYFQNLSRGKEANIYVQINFEASNYIYDAIENLELKIRNKDSQFFEKLGLTDDGSIVLTNIEIEPLVSLNDIFERIDEDNKNVVAFLEQAQYEENLLTSEIFVPTYKTHKIELKTLGSADDDVIGKVMAYLNSNVMLNKIKDVNVERTLLKIRQNERNIAHIDSLNRVLGDRDKNGGTSSQIYVNTSQLVNLHFLYEELNKYVDENKSLNIELLKYDEVVTVMNKPLLQEPKLKLLDRKMIIFPILFIIIYFVIIFLLKSYSRAKKLSEHRR